MFLRRLHLWMIAVLRSFLICAADMQQHDPLDVWELVQRDECIFDEAQAYALRDPRDCLRYPCDLWFKNEFCAVDLTSDSGTDPVCKPLTPACVSKISKIKVQIRQKEAPRTTTARRVHRRFSTTPSQGKLPKPTQAPFRVEKFDQTREAEPSTTLATQAFTPRVRNECDDTNEFCQFWTEHGECRTNPQYMETFCRRSCDACPSPQAVLKPQCVDFYEMCPRWAAEAQCRENPAFMSVNCMASCKEC